MLSFRLFRISIIIFVICLYGCEKPAEDALNFGLASLPSNLDPLFATDASSTRIDRLLYQRLVHFNEAQQAIPGIANWTIIKDTQYRFQLNDNVAPFHDNQPLNSADIKATYDFILDENNASPHRGSLALIKKIELLDNNTLDFYLSRADPLFPAYLAIGIVPKKLLDKQHAFNKQPLGSGPYKYISTSNDGKIILQRRSDQLKLQFVYVPDPTVRLLKLMHGELDILQNDIQPEMINYVSRKKQINIEKIPGSNFSYIGFNLQDEMLKQKSIRLAIAYGIDRQEIIQYVFSQSAKPAQSILTADHWAGNSALKAYQYQPDKARQLLLAAGYSPGNPLILSFKTSSDPFRLRLASIYQHQLAKIGIQLDIQSFDWGTFFGDIKAGRFQLYSLSWVGINTPDIFRYTSHSDSVPPKGANRGRFFDKRTDDLIEQAETRTDLRQQARIYAELQAHLLQELPYIPLWYEDHVIIKNNRISNYHVSSQGNYDGLIQVSLH